MTARRLWSLVYYLPKDAATTFCMAEDHQEDSGQSQPATGDRHLQPARCLEDIPVARSMAEVAKFVNSSADEFSTEFGQQAG